MSAVMSKRTVCFFSLLVSRCCFFVVVVVVVCCCCWFFVSDDVFLELLMGVDSRLELDRGLLSEEEEAVDAEEELP